MSSAELDRRVVALHHKASRTAPGGASARSLSLELSEVGQAYLDRGEYGRAIELLEEAYGWDAENGLALAHLTLACVRAGNFETARFYLELAEERSAQAPPGIYGVLGEISYELNRLDEAILAWEQYWRLGGREPRTLSRLARAWQERSVALGQRLLLGEEFTFYYDPSIGDGAVEEIGRQLEECYRQQSAFFGARLPGPQIVILYAGRAYFSLVSIPDWVSGVFDGKIRVAVDPRTGAPDALRAVLCHELAHALIRYASRDRAPGWLHEGIAQWWEGRHLDRGIVREAFAGRRVHSLAEMEGNLARKTDQAAARTNYVEALGLVEYLVHRHGSASVACIVRDMGDGLSMAEALSRETGLSANEVVAWWKAAAGL